MADARIFYDVDNAFDIRSLISTDPLIIAKPALDKFNALNLDSKDLVLVKRVMDGALKIVDIDKVDGAFIGKYLK